MMQRMNIQVPLTVSNNKQPSGPRPWMRLGSLLTLTGYIGQLTCQFLVVSGLWLSLPSSATEKEPQQEPCSAKFYQDSDHLLTNDFWRGKDISNRLQIIRPAIEKLAEFMKGIYPENSENNNHKELLTKKAEDFIKHDWDRYSEILGRITGRNLKDYLKDFETPKSPEELAEELIRDYYKEDHFKWKTPPSNGQSGTKVTILEHQGFNHIAIKEFKNTEENPNKIKEGLKELFDSLMAHTHTLNPFVAYIIVRDCFLSTGIAYVELC